MGERAKERIDCEFLRLLQENGFEKISITDICRGAKVNRTTFYEYYHSKSELLCTLQMAYFDRMYDEFADEFNSKIFEIICLGFTKGTGEKKKVKFSVI